MARKINKLKKPAMKTSQATLKAAKGRKVSAKRKAA